MAGAGSFETGAERASVRAHHEANKIVKQGAGGGPVPAGIFYARGRAFATRERIFGIEIPGSQEHTDRLASEAAAAGGPVVAAPPSTKRSVTGESAAGGGAVVAASQEERRLRAKQRLGVE